MPAKTRSLILFLILVVADCALWYAISRLDSTRLPQIYFLNVGQGDAALAIFPTGVKMLIDAGPDGSAVKKLDEIIPPHDRYIDLVMISHPQLDHFGGLPAIMRRYEIGALLVNGRLPDTPDPQWTALMNIVKETQTALITLREGDSISNLSSRVHIISPNNDTVQSGELNDTSLVALLQMSPINALFTGDVGANMEHYLSKKEKDLRSNILKVPHHGSKFSSSIELLNAVKPQIAVVNVGARNRYGHPSPETIARYASLENPPKVFRTDTAGTILVEGAQDTLKVFTEH